MATSKLYDRCPMCDDGCHLCVRGFCEVGLTVGQAERAVKAEQALRELIAALMHGTISPGTAGKRLSEALASARAALGMK